MTGESFLSAPAWTFDSYEFAGAAAGTGARLGVVANTRPLPVFKVEVPAPPAPIPLTGAAFGPPTASAIASSFFCLVAASYAPARPRVSSSLLTAVMGSAAGAVAVPGTDVPCAGAGSACAEG